MGQSKTTPESCVPGQVQFKARAAQGITPGIRDFFAPTPPKPRREKQTKVQTATTDTAESQQVPISGNEDAMEEEEGTTEQS